MKEKIIDYIETLEAKAYQSDYYFKQRNELYISNQEKDKEIERLNNIIEHTDSWIDRTIEVIKQQPSEDDTWILERLNCIKQCLKGSE